MRFPFALIVLFALTTGTVVAQDLTSEKGKLSYAVGWDIGEDIQRRGAEFDVEAIIAAIRDSSAKKEPQVPAEEMVAMLTELQQRVRQEQAEAFQKLAEENQKKSEEFLAANLGKSGIVALPSGIQYRIIDEGDGARPGMESTVKVHYRGSGLAGSAAADEDRRYLADFRAAGNGLWRPRQSAGGAERGLDLRSQTGRNRPVGADSFAIPDIRDANSGMTKRCLGAASAAIVCAAITREPLVLK
ncbi:MAG: FKBP-type peptidyl-prolyl cis-trans isomerase N-terminal domain-containing protein [Xanthomonadales bacterium]|nr:FKBP-type peptidyl-prolyl cis-trans isomerase N-terminal domain-containing protein [Xanthomonadales bacterium]